VRDRGQRNWWAPGHCAKWLSTIHSFGSPDLQWPAQTTLLPIAAERREEGRRYVRVFGMRCPIERHARRIDEANVTLTSASRSAVRVYRVGLSFISAVKALMAASWATRTEVDYGIFGIRDRLGSFRLASAAASRPRTICRQPASRHTG